jgi:hypothetical protein
VIEPETPRRGDDLACRIVQPSADLDGDTVSYSYAWSRNDRPAPPAAAGTDPSRVEASRISKGERWRCTVTPSDGTATGPGASAERAVANTPPGPAIVRLEPATPRAGSALRCDVVAKSDDADSDSIRYRFVWQRNGTPQPFAESSQDVPARLVKAGDRWRCTVTPTDGSEDGPQSGSEEGMVASGETESPIRQPASRGP